ncbi:MAG: hypothetical protein JWM11_3121 [Planctomycetaceae bacterium]|nr:hypothetical protein [Planctomycetaceae bacterium]
MKIAQSLTIATTALLACGFVYSDDFRSLVGAKTGSPVRNGSQVEQFAQAEGEPKVPATDAKQPQPAAAEERKPEDVLASATEKLRGYSSVRTKISEKVVMKSGLTPQTFRFGATGEYLQGQNLKLKMSIEVKLTPELTGKLKEVCDGELLWSSYELGSKDKTEITRRDVRQILKALDELQQGARLPASEKSIQQAGLIGTLGLGGLPALLTGLEKDFEFKKLTTEKIDDREVLTLEGTWNAAWTAQLMERMYGNKKPKKEKDKPAEPLPPNIPDVVRVSIDKQTEFPRRIEYLKRTTGQTVLSPLMQIDFTEPKFNERLSRDEFVFFVPNDAKPRDDTQQYLQRIGALKAPPAGGAGAAPVRAPEKTK